MAALGVSNSVRVHVLLDLTEMNYAIDVLVHGRILQNCQKTFVRLTQRVRALPYPALDLLNFTIGVITAATTLSVSFLN